MRQLFLYPYTIVLGSGAENFRLLFLQNIRCLKEALTRDFLCWSFFLSFNKSSNFPRSYSPQRRW
jgi:hypothetical protein